MQMRKALALAVLATAIGRVALAQSAGDGSHDEIFDQISAEQSHLERMQSAGEDSFTIAHASQRLGQLCESAGMLAQAEVFLQRAIDLYPVSASAERMAARNDLATLLATVGEASKAEREDRIVLAEAEKAGDLGAISLAWVNLADVEIWRKHFPKAVDYARKAVLLEETASSLPTIGRVAAEQALGFALAGDRQCDLAIPVLQGVVALSKSAYGEESTEAGINQYVLGHAAWQCGDPADAAVWMQQGLQRLRSILESKEIIYLRAVYLHATEEYATLLRENGRVEEAATVEREVRMANASVDVHTMMPVSASLH